MCPSKERVVKGIEVLDFFYFFSLTFFLIEWSVLWNNKFLCHFRWCSMWQNRPHSHFLWDSLLRLCSEGSLQSRVCRGGQKALWHMQQDIVCFGPTGLILYCALFSLSIQPVLPSVKAKDSFRDLPSQLEEVSSLLPLPWESPVQVILDLC